LFKGDCAFRAKLKVSSLFGLVAGVKFNLSGREQLDACARDKADPSLLERILGAVFKIGCLKIAILQEAVEHPLRGKGPAHTSADLAERR
jgi:hypothetical protein